MKQANSQLKKASRPFSKGFPPLTVGQPVFICHNADNLYLLISQGLHISNLTGNLYKML